MPHFLFQFLQADIHARLLHGTADKRYNLIVIITFGDIIESAVLNGLHPVRDITVRRQQDYLYVRGCFLDRRHKVYPVTVRKKHIAQDYIRALKFQLLQSSPAITGLAYFISFQLQHTRQKSTDLYFIVND